MGVIQSHRCHDLKTWSEPWAYVASGHKTYEVRRDDRDYQVGDLLLLREYDPEASAFTGWAVLVQVKHVTRGPPSPLPEGVVVLGIEVISRSFQFIGPPHQDSEGGA